MATWRTRVADWLAPERRSAFLSMDSIIASYEAGGAPAPGRLESLSAVAACVDLISSGVASLPATLTVDGPDGQAPAPPSATAWSLLRRPAPMTTWPTLVRHLVASYLLNGNGAAWLKADGRGAVREIVPIPWPWLSAQIIEGAGGQPRLVFAVAPSTEAKLLGLPSRLAAEDMLLIRQRSDDGVLGRSVLARASAALTGAAALESIALATFENASRPSGMVTVPPGLKAESKRRMEAHWSEQYTGRGAAGRVVFADKDSTFTPFSTPPVDLQLQEARAHSVADVCRLFGVPEVLIQPRDRVPADLAPFIAAWAQLCLSPAVTALESEFDAAVLPEGVHLQLDMGGLLRGAFSAAAGAMSVLVQSGVWTPNDARRSLGLPAHPDGDGLRAPGAPSYPADAAGVPSLAPKPGPGGDLPNVGTHEGDGAG